MTKIICTLPNASENINGVKFVSHAKGMISQSIDDEDVVEAFLSIDGYELADAGEKSPAAPKNGAKKTGVKTPSASGKAVETTESNESTESTTEGDTSTDPDNGGAGNGDEPPKK